MQYTVCVPQQRTVTREVCVVKCVPEQKCGHPNGSGSRCVEKQVEVRVCKMVQKTVQVPCCPPRTRSCARPAAAAAPPRRPAPAPPAPGAE